MSFTDTIAAISTGSKGGAVGMVRLSGNDALKIADRVFKSKSGKKIIEKEGYTALFGTVYDEGGEFDTAVALVFRAPKSYTGENIVELTVHGGSYLTKRLLRAVIKSGARPAEAGEFTKRAFLNGKMTLSQAEAVTSLISAEGEGAARAAMMASEGRVNEESERLRSKIVTIIGEIAAYCDYPDEDIVDVSRETLLKELEEIINSLEELIHNFDKGRIVMGGVDTAIVGSPNVGKSTIMNLLSGFEKSIVTDIAGTTRDIVEDTVNVGAFNLRLSDTAGIRNTEDTVEAFGVERAKKRFESAAFVIAVFDSSKPLSHADSELIKKAEGRCALAVINKDDLESNIDEKPIKQAFRHTIRLSANEKGADRTLSAAIEEALLEYRLSEDAVILLNERQFSCVERAKKEVDSAYAALLEGQTPDMIGIVLEDALRHLSELSGENANDAVVNEIFSKFCVGK